MCTFTVDAPGDEIRTYLLVGGPADGKNVTLRGHVGYRTSATEDGVPAQEHHYGVHRFVCDLMLWGGAPRKANGEPDITRTAVLTALLAQEKLRGGE